MRRFNGAIELEHEGQVRASTRVCVAPSDQVASANVVESSSMSSYDQAVVDDAKSPTYVPYTAPVDTRLCQTVEVG